VEPNIEEKYQYLKSRLEDMGSALLAFSGGVDSTLVLAVGREALGDNIVAVTVHSPLHPQPMLDEAARTASRLRAEHITVDADELSSDEFVENPPERCYICKHARYTELLEIAAREGISEVLDGSQTEDIGDYRPGMRAAEELGVRSPLLEAGLAKYEVRALSRELGLSTWNMPSSTCLATRVPYGERITREKLNVIVRGEEFLKELGLSQVRLRFVEDRTARIEVAPSSLPLVTSEGIRERILSRMKDLGFVYTTVDLAGYRTGALNEALEER